MALMASAVKQWMEWHADEYRDSAGEVIASALAEGAAQEFGDDHIGGPLDDETHPLWDWAAQVASSCDERE